VSSIRKKKLHHPISLFGVEIINKQAIIHWLMIIWIWFIWTYLAAVKIFNRNMGGEVLFFNIYWKEEWEDDMWECVTTPKCIYNTNDLRYDTTLLITIICEETECQKVKLHEYYPVTKSIFTCYCRVNARLMNCKGYIHLRITRMVFMRQMIIYGVETL